MLDLNEVVDWSHPSRQTKKRKLRLEHAHARYRPSRRDFVKAMGAIGAGLAINAIGFFPVMRRAAASDSPPGEWLIYSGWGSSKCGGLGSWVDNDNCTGCDTVDNILCCCSGGYAKGPAHGCKYRFRPNVCKSGGYDGWVWKMTICCLISFGVCKSNRQWRCSDGCYRSSCSNGWTKSICRSVTSSGSNCTPCAI